MDDNREDTSKDDLEAFEEWESAQEPPVAGGGAETSPPSEEAFEAGFQDVDLAGENPPQQAFEQGAPPAGEEEIKTAAQDFAASLLSLAPDVAVNLVAVIGKTTTTVGDLMKCRIGHVIDLGRPPAETVDVVVNGRLIARGELVEMDGSLGVRILKMVK